MQNSFKGFASRELSKADEKISMIGGMYLTSKMNDEATVFGDLLQPRTVSLAINFW